MMNSSKRRKKGADAFSMPLTERQQLAYILAKTAKEAQGDDGSGSDDAHEIKRIRKSSGIPKVDRPINTRGESSLHVAATKGDIDTVKDLIKQGADVNIKDNAQWTPLHEACNHGFYKIAKHLVKAGANVNVIGCDGDTPLHDASTNGHLKVVLLLLKHGADPRRKNGSGERPIDVADNEDVEKALHNFTKDMLHELKVSRGLTPEKRKYADGGEGSSKSHLPSSQHTPKKHKRHIRNISDFLDDDEEDDSQKIVKAERQDKQEQNSSHGPSSSKKINSSHHETQSVKQEPIDVTPSPNAITHGMTFEIKMNKEDVSKYQLQNKPVEKDSSNQPSSHYKPPKLHESSKTLHTESKPKIHKDSLVDTVKKEHKEHKKIDEQSPLISNRKHDHEKSQKAKEHKKSHKTDKSDMDRDLVKKEHKERVKNNEDGKKDKTKIHKTEHSVEKQEMKKEHKNYLVNDGSAKHKQKKKSKHREHDERKHSISKEDKSLLKKTTDKPKGIVDSKIESTEEKRKKNISRLSIDDFLGEETEVNTEKKLPAPATKTLTEHAGVTPSPEDLIKQHFATKSKSTATDKANKHNTESKLHSKSLKDQQHESPVKAAKDVDTVKKNLTPKKKLCRVKGFLDDDTDSGEEVTTQTITHSKVTEERNLSKLNTPLAPESNVKVIDQENAADQKLMKSAEKTEKAKSKELEKDWPTYFKQKSEKHKHKHKKHSKEKPEDRIEKKHSKEKHEDRTERKLNEKSEDRAEKKLIKEKLEDRVEIKPYKDKFEDSVEKKPLKDKFDDRADKKLVKEKHEEKAEKKMKAKHEEKHEKHENLRKEEKAEKKLLKEKHEKSEKKILKEKSEIKAEKKMHKHHDGHVSKEQTDQKKGKERTEKIEHKPKDKLDTELTESRVGELTMKDNISFQDEKLMKNPIVLLSKVQQKLDGTAESSVFNTARDSDTLKHGIQHKEKKSNITTESEKLHVKKHKRNKSAEKILTGEKKEMKQKFKDLYIPDVFGNITPPIKISKKKETDGNKKQEKHKKHSDEHQAHQNASNVKNIEKDVMKEKIDEKSKPKVKDDLTLFYESVKGAPQLDVKVVDCKLVQETPSVEPKQWLKNGEKQQVHEHILTCGPKPEKKIKSEKIEHIPIASEIPSEHHLEKKKLKRKSSDGDSSLKKQKKKEHSENVGLANETDIVKKEIISNKSQPILTLTDVLLEQKDAPDHSTPEAKPIDAEKAEKLVLCEEHKKSSVKTKEVEKDNKDSKSSSKAHKTETLNKPPSDLKKKNFHFKELDLNSSMGLNNSVLKEHSKKKKRKRLSDSSSEQKKPKLEQDHSKKALHEDSKTTSHLSKSTSKPEQSDLKEKLHKDGSQHKPTLLSQQVLTDVDSVKKHKVHDSIMVEERKQGTFIEKETHEAKQKRLVLEEKERKKLEVKQQQEINRRKLLEIEMKRQQEVDMMKQEEIKQKKLDELQHRPQSEHDQEIRSVDDTEKQKSLETEERRLKDESEKKRSEKIRKKHEDRKHQEEQQKRKLDSELKKTKEEDVQKKLQEEEAIQQLLKEEEQEERQRQADRQKQLEEEKKRKAQEIIEQKKREEQMRKIKEEEELLKKQKYEEEIERKRLEELQKAKQELQMNEENEDAVGHLLSMEDEDEICVEPEDMFSPQEFMISQPTQQFYDVPKQEQVKVTQASLEQIDTIQPSDAVIETPVKHEGATQQQFVEKDVIHPSSKLAAARNQPFEQMGVLQPPYEQTKTIQPVFGQTGVIEPQFEQESTMQRPFHQTGVLAPLIKQVDIPPQPFKQVEALQPSFKHSSSSAIHSQFLQTETSKPSLKPAESLQLPLALSDEMQRPFKQAGANQPTFKSAVIEAILPAYQPVENTQQPFKQAVKDTLMQPPYHQIRSTQPPFEHVAAPEVTMQPSFHHAGNTQPPFEQTAAPEVTTQPSFHHAGNTLPPFEQTNTEALQPAFQRIESTHPSIEHAITENVIQSPFQQIESKQPELKQASHEAKQPASQQITSTHTQIEHVKRPMEPVLQQEEMESIQSSYDNTKVFHPPFEHSISTEYPIIREKNTSADADSIASSLRVIPEIDSETSNEFKVLDEPILSPIHQVPIGKSPKHELIETRTATKSQTLVTENKSIFVSDQSYVDKILPTVNDNASTKTNDKEENLALSDQTKVYPTETVSIEKHANEVIQTSDDILDKKEEISTTLQQRVQTESQMDEQKTSVIEEGKTEPVEKEQPEQPSKAEEKSFESHPTSDATKDSPLSTFSTSSSSHTDKMAVHTSSHHNFNLINPNHYPHFRLDIQTELQLKHEQYPGLISPSVESSSHFNDLDTIDPSDLLKTEANHTLLETEDSHKLLKDSERTEHRDSNRYEESALTRCLSPDEVISNLAECIMNLDENQDEQLHNYTPMRSKSSEEIRKELASSVNSDISGINTSITPDSTFTSSMDASQLPTFSNSSFNLAQAFATSYHNDSVFQMNQKFTPTTGEQQQQSGISMEQQNYQQPLFVSTHTSARLSASEEKMYSPKHISAGERLYSPRTSITTDDYKQRNHKVDLEPCSILRSIINSELTDIPIPIILPENITNVDNNKGNIEENATDIQKDNATSSAIATTATTTSESSKEEPIDTSKIKKIHRLRTWREAVKQRCTRVETNAFKRDSHRVLTPVVDRKSYNDILDEAQGNTELHDMLVRHSSQKEKLRVCMIQELARVECNCKLMSMEKGPIGATTVLYFQHDQYSRNMARALDFKNKATVLPDFKKLHDSNLTNLQDKFETLQKTLLAQQQMEIETLKAMQNFQRYDYKDVLRNRYLRFKYKMS